MYMPPERSAASVGAFMVVMPAHGARPQQLALAAIDTSPAYQKRCAGASASSAKRVTGHRFLNVLLQKWAIMKCAVSLFWVNLFFANTFIHLSCME